MLKTIAKTLTTIVTLSLVLTGCQTTQQRIAKQKQQDPTLAQIQAQSVVDEKSSRYFALVGVDGKEAKTNLVKSGPHIIYIYGLVEHTNGIKTQLYSAKHALKVRLEPGETYDVKSTIRNDQAQVWIVNSQSGQVASSLSQEPLTLEQSPEIERIIVKGKRTGQKLKGYITEREFKVFFRKSIAAPEGSLTGDKAPLRCLYTPVCMG